MLFLGWEGYGEGMRAGYHPTSGLGGNRGKGSLGLAWEDGSYRVCAGFTTRAPIFFGPWRLAGAHAKLGLSEGKSDQVGLKAYISQERRTSLSLSAAHNGFFSDQSVALLPLNVYSTPSYCGVFLPVFHPDPSHPIWSVLKIIVARLKRGVLPPGGNASSESGDEKGTLILPL